MDDMESKMASILGNPQMMEQIQKLAQSFGAQNSGESSQKQPTQAAPPESFPDLDLGIIQKISGLMEKSQINFNQKSLLNALAPYVNSQRISRLERAMRAAKMASMASALLGR